MSKDLRGAENMLEKCISPPFMSE